MAAWNEPDEEKRRQLLVQVWTDVGTYTDPQSSAAGRDAFVALIGAFRQRFQGTRIELSSNVDEHHGVLQFAWSIVGLLGLGFDYAPDDALWEQVERAVVVMP